MVQNDFYQLDPEEVLSKYALSSEWVTPMEKIVKAEKIKIIRLMAAKTIQLNLFLVIQL